MKQSIRTMVAVTLFSLCMVSNAEDRAMIVFDASGSMWAQMEGKTKIEVAKKTLSNLVNSWDQNKQLGLLVYGHRKKGDCNDIQTLVPVAKLDKAKMITQVNAINPKGKTPISAAIKMAAEELKFTEDAATIILISDGKESCNADPCTTATTLEQMGINFTAHVIGFGVNKETGKQLKCIADNTGGKYLTADNANQLNKALKEVTEEAKPKPAIATLQADENTFSGAELAVTWQGPSEDGDYITVADLSMPATTYHSYTYTRENNPLEVEMPDKPGEYELRYIRNKTNKIIAKRAVTVILVPAKLEADESISSGASLTVKWEGPDNKRDFITIADKAMTGSKYHNYTYTNNGSPLNLKMPDKPGDYEIRYIQGQSSKILQRKAITVTAVSAKLEADESTPSGGTLSITWEGPDNKSDFISIADKAMTGSKYHNYTYTNNGSPLNLKMPDKPGDYEIRYIQGQSSKILQRKAITVTAVSAKLEADESTPSGGTLSITWEGPDNKSDFISIADKAMPGSQYHNYTYTNNGSPLNLKMPDKPGDYEIRYIQGQSSKILQRKAITVTAVSAKLEADESTPSGGTLSITWEGPDNKSDFISIADKAMPGSQYHNYTYTNNGSPLNLTMPDKPGDYEIRYIQGQSSKILQRKDITVHQ